MSKRIELENGSVFENVEFLGSGVTAEAYSYANYVILAVRDDNDIMRMGLSDLIREYELSGKVVPDNVPYVQFMGEGKVIDLCWDESKNATFYRMDRYIPLHRSSSPKDDSYGGYKIITDMNKAKRPCDTAIIKKKTIKMFCKEAEKMGIDKSIIESVKFIYKALKQAKENYGCYYRYGFDMHNGNIMVDKNGRYILTDIFHIWD